MRCLIRNFSHFLNYHWTLSVIAAVVFYCTLLVTDTEDGVAEVMIVAQERLAGDPFLESLPLVVHSS